MRSLANEVCIELTTTPSTLAGDERPSPKLHSALLPPLLRCRRPARVASPRARLLRCTCHAGRSAGGLILTLSICHLARLMRGTSGRPIEIWQCPLSHALNPLQCRLLLHLYPLPNRIGPAGRAIESDRRLTFRPKGIEPGAPSGALVVRGRRL